MGSSKKYQANLDAVATQKRRDRVEDFILTGLCDPHRIGLVLGVDELTVVQDMAAIRERWTATRPRTKKLREQLIAINQHALHLAFVEWEKSKNAQETTRTTYEKRRCPECKGERKVASIGKPLKKCPKCSGTGEVTEEVVTHKVKGQCGDPRYLQLVNVFGREIARLSGLGIKKKPTNQERQEQQHLHLHLNPIVEQWKNAPPDLLVQAKILVDQLSQDVVTKPEEDGKP
jgi:hypothetical protein